jgi:hypothetical protein
MVLITNKMNKNKLNHDRPDVLESQRIAEIKALSYLERLERLMVILEVSYMLQTASKLNNSQHN